ncbi:MFS transporter [Thermostaphylospora chromogena]|nr:MFS transporter [Thermostaphylospora chromogena]
MENSSTAGREVRDWRGRVYLTGIAPEQILNRPRSAVVWAAMAAMAALGVLQYGFAATLPAVAAARDWTTGEALRPLAVWAVCQAASGLPTAALMERRGTGGGIALRPGTAMTAGALLSAIGLLALAHAPTPAWVFAGYSVLGGIGGGLVYATCSSVVARWYPERAAGRVSLVTGAFAYGAVPFVVAVHAVHAGAPSAVVPLIDVAAVVVGLTIAVTGRLLREPPRHWWPSHIDPRTWAMDGRINPALRCNPRAVRDFSAGDALRTPALPTMAAILVLAGALSLFNVVSAAWVAADHGPAAAAVATTALIALNGAGRAVSVAISERTGRRTALLGVLAVLTGGQVALAGAVSTGSTASLVAFVCLAGLGGGAFYPLIACLVREYFGERRTDEIHGVIYAAKGVGGPIGIVLAAAMPAGESGVCLLAALLGLATVVLARGLRQPGRPRTLPVPDGHRTAVKAGLNGRPE